MIHQSLTTMVVQIVSSSAQSFDTIAWSPLMPRPSCHYAVETSRSISKWQSWDKQLTKPFMRHNNFKNVSCLMTSHRRYQDTPDTCGTREQATKLQTNEHCCLQFTLIMSLIMSSLVPFLVDETQIIIRNIAGVHGFLSFTKIDKWLNAYCQLAFFYLKHATDGHFRKQQLFHLLETDTKEERKERKQYIVNNWLNCSRSWIISSRFTYSFAFCLIFLRDIDRQQDAKAWRPRIPRFPRPRFPRFPRPRFPRIPRPRFPRIPRPRFPRIPRPRFRGWGKKWSIKGEFVTRKMVLNRVC